MNDFVLALRQVRYQNRSFWRNPTVAFFTFLLPLIFLVILNALLGNNIRQLPGGQAELAYFYVPSMVALSIINACYTSLVMTISIARDDGVLKRFPVKHLSEACQAAFNPFQTGSGFEWLDLAIVAAWGLAAAVLAVRLFSWYPRE